MSGVEQSPESGAISLARARATCSVCGVAKNQIDGTHERAEQVVRQAMERHYRDEHPEVCICCGEDSSEGPIDSDGNHWCGECPRDGVVA